MESVRQEFNKLESKCQLAYDVAIGEVDKVLAQLYALKESESQDRSALNEAIKHGNARIQDAQKGWHGSLNKYAKAVDKKFSTPLTPLFPTPSTSPPQFGPSSPPPPSIPFTSFASRDALNSTIASHFVRRGQFALGEAWIAETGAKLGVQEAESFRICHDILQAIGKRDFSPALQWAHENETELQRRGSELQYRLRRRVFISLVLESAGAEDGVVKAIQYLQTYLAPDFSLYGSDISRLLASTAYPPNSPTSPYADIYSPFLEASSSTSDSETALKSLFVTEYCSTHGFSRYQPLSVALDVGANGGVAKLQRVKAVMKDKKTEWTSEGELPVAIPLPEMYRFHSIFACPVSKEQSSDVNPPMMLPCGHVIAKESLQRLAKGGACVFFVFINGRLEVDEIHRDRSVKCPYCPVQSAIHHTMQVYF
ncbi:hypothetical protein BT69DRAFT_1290612 [Atractiella rhizophila]|nr:hypothetical protein BT69DRAFT_1290612 [Atractiella rhizophila]